MCRHLALTYAYTETYCLRQTIPESVWERPGDHDAIRAIDCICRSCTQKRLGKAEESLQQNQGAAHSVQPASPQTPHGSPVKPLQAQVMWSVHTAAAPSFVQSAYPSPRPETCSLASKSSDASSRSTTTRRRRSIDSSLASRIIAFEGKREDTATTNATERSTSTTVSHEQQSEKHAPEPAAHAVDKEADASEGHSPRPFAARSSPAENDVHLSSRWDVVQSPVIAFRNQDELEIGLDLMRKRWHWLTASPSRFPEMPRSSTAVQSDASDSDGEEDVSPWEGMLRESQSMHGEGDDGSEWWTLTSSFRWTARNRQGMWTGLPEAGGLSTQQVTGSGTQLCDPRKKREEDSLRGNAVGRGSVDSLIQAFSAAPLTPSNTQKDAEQFQRRDESKACDGCIWADVAEERRRFVLTCVHACALVRMLCVCSYVRVCVRCTLSEHTSMCIHGQKMHAQTHEHTHTIQGLGRIGKPQQAANQEVETATCVRARGDPAVSRGVKGANDCTQEFTGVTDIHRVAAANSRWRRWGWNFARL